jgi:tRNA (adenine22-N1)-methyltransferase
VASFVPRGAVVADIGSDHGFLPVRLVATGVCARCVATDSREDPLEATRRTVEAYGLTHRIDLRLGNGLEVLFPGETTVVVMAGIGGRTIAALLSGGVEVARSQEMLILQPMTEAAAVRKWAMSNDIAVSGEDIAAEGERLYQVICLDPRSPWRERVAPDDVRLEIGLTLLRDRHPLVKPLVLRMLSECDSVMAEMADRIRMDDPRFRRWRDRSLQLEGVLRWL